MKSVVKGSFSIPKNGGILPKITVVNLDISSEIKQDTMCGNINGMCFKLTKDTCKKLHVLCVETKTVKRSMYYVWKHYTIVKLQDMKLDILTNFLHHI